MTNVWYAGIWGNRLDITWTYCDTDEERRLAVYEAAARAGLRVIGEGEIRVTDDGGFCAFGWAFRGTGCGMHLSPELSAKGVWDEIPCHLLPRGLGDLYLDCTGAPQ